jgi:hypothetical protein
VHRHPSDVDEVSSHLRWFSSEAAKLRFLFTDQHTTPDEWFSDQWLGSSVTSLDAFKREFVSATRKAWPVALVQSLAQRQNLPSRCVSAVIYEPSQDSKDREIIAQWPFDVRVRCKLENVSDLTQIYVKVQNPVERIAIDAL